MEQQDEDYVKTPQEEYLLKESQRIQDVRKASSGNPQNMKLAKCHHQYLVEEMIWMAKEFQKERIQKQTQTRKIGRAILKHVIDPEKKEELRLKQEEQNKKKLSAQISKEVNKWWLKAYKIAQHKYNLSVQEESKKQMDRQLDYLLEQTEKYSIMLAQQLGQSFNESAQVRRNGSRLLLNSQQLSQDEGNNQDNQNMIVENLDGNGKGKIQIDKSIKHQVQNDWQNQHQINLNSQNEQQNLNIMNNQELEQQSQFKNSKQMSKDLDREVPRRQDTNLNNNKDGDINDKSNKQQKIQGTEIQDNSQFSQDKQLKQEAEMQQIENKQYLRKSSKKPKRDTQDLKDEVQDSDVYNFDDMDNNTLKNDQKGKRITRNQKKLAKIERKNSSEVESYSAKSEESDHESTLSQEERKEQENPLFEGKQEQNVLEDDQNLSLEEIIKRYYGGIEEDNGQQDQEASPSARQKQSRKRGIKSTKSKKRPKLNNKSGSQDINDFVQKDEESCNQRADNITFSGSNKIVGEKHQDDPHGSQSQESNYKPNDKLVQQQENSLINVKLEQKLETEPENKDLDKGSKSHSSKRKILSNSALTPSLTPPEARRGSRRLSGQAPIVKAEDNVNKLGRKQGSRTFKVEDTIEKPGSKKSSRVESGQKDEVNNIKIYKKQASKTAKQDDKQEGKGGQFIRRQSLQGENSNSHIQTRRQTRLSDNSRQRSNDKGLESNKVYPRSDSNLTQIKVTATKDQQISQRVSLNEIEKSLEANQKVNNSNNNQSLSEEHPINMDSSDNCVQQNLQQEGGTKNYEELRQDSQGVRMKTWEGEEAQYHNQQYQQNDTQQQSKSQQQYILQHQDQNDDKQQSIAVTESQLDIQDKGQVNLQADVKQEMPPQLNDQTKIDLQMKNIQDDKPLDKQALEINQGQQQQQNEFIPDHLKIQESRQEIQIPSQDVKQDNNQKQTQNNQEIINHDDTQQDDMQIGNKVIELNTIVEPKIQTSFLLKHQLREYQLTGLRWLWTLCQNNFNGILADEMGLGKTIQTIALLAQLATERAEWGPHLIVVPTSVMLNWEIEFKKWAPAFRILTYFGNQKERKIRRQGWSKNNSFHVCITTYTLIAQDAKIFRRKKWRYIILDEAHLIKNWRTKRWQTLTSLHSRHRLLITGTPLQNDLIELWSLMHFLMPNLFRSHDQFKEWFSNPLSGMVEGTKNSRMDIVERLHSVLRPFILRRLKVEVETQLPGKFEHVVLCRLSKRQRNLYEEYMQNSDTQNVLQSQNTLGLINVLMQLRKVCNHPDLFEGRQIRSSFDSEPLQLKIPQIIMDVQKPQITEADQSSQVTQYLELSSLPIVSNTRVPSSLIFSRPEVMALGEATPSSEDQIRKVWIQAYDQKSFKANLIEVEETPGQAIGSQVQWNQGFLNESCESGKISLAAQIALKKELIHQNEIKRQWLQSRLQMSIRTNQQRFISNFYAQTAQLQDHLQIVSLLGQAKSIDLQRIRDTNYTYLEFDDSVGESWLQDLVRTPTQRELELRDVIAKFTCVIPKARAREIVLNSKPQIEEIVGCVAESQIMKQFYESASGVLHQSSIRQKLFFPDKWLVQFDCGKLQKLAELLKVLQRNGHRVLIFTQMSKMLDVLEVFLNLHRYTYMRLDGQTGPEQRQILMTRFNNDRKYFLFILSTRSGGVGINLTGADTVIFYDSDWNPAIDQQAQDRCHRIGQTHEVHIYRFVSQNTMEENIQLKSQQKRQLDYLAIQSGKFSSDYFDKMNPGELLGGDMIGSLGGGQKSVNNLSQNEIKAAMRNAEDEDDAQAAINLEKENQAEQEEFQGDQGNDLEKDQQVQLAEQKTVVEKGEQLPKEELQNYINALPKIDQYAIGLQEEEIRNEALYTNQLAKQNVELDMNDPEEAMEIDQAEDNEGDLELIFEGEWNQQEVEAMYKNELISAQAWYQTETKKFFEARNLALEKIQQQRQKKQQKRLRQQQAKIIKSKAIQQKLQEQKLRAAMESERKMLQAVENLSNDQSSTHNDPSLQRNQIENGVRAKFQEQNKFKSPFKSTKVAPIQFQNQEENLQWGALIRPWTQYETLLLCICVQVVFSEVALGKYQLQIPLFQLNQSDEVWECVSSLLRNIWARLMQRKQTLGDLIWSQYGPQNQINVQQNQFWRFYAVRSQGSCKDNYAKFIAQNRTSLAGQPNITYQNQRYHQNCTQAYQNLLSRIVDKLYKNETQNQENYNGISLEKQNNHQFQNNGQKYLSTYPSTFQSQLYQLQNNQNSKQDTVIKVNGQIAKLNQSGNQEIESLSKDKSGNQLTNDSNDGKINQPQVQLHDNKDSTLLKDKTVQEIINKFDLHDTSRFNSVPVTILTSKQIVEKIASCLPDEIQEQTDRNWIREEIQRMLSDYCYEAKLQKIQQKLGTADTQHPTQNKYNTNNLIIQKQLRTPIVRKTSNKPEQQGTKKSEIQQGQQNDRIIHKSAQSQRPEEFNSQLQNQTSNSLGQRKTSTQNDIAKQKSNLQTLQQQTQNIINLQNIKVPENGKGQLQAQSQVVQQIQPQYYLQPQQQGVSQQSFVQRLPYQLINQPGGQYLAATNLNFYKAMGNNNQGGNINAFKIDNSIIKQQNGRQQGNMPQGMVQFFSTPMQQPINQKPVQVSVQGISTNQSKDKNQEQQGQTLNLGQQYVRLNNQNSQQPSNSQVVQRQFFTMPAKNSNKLQGSQSQEAKATSNQQIYNQGLGVKRSHLQEAGSDEKRQKLNQNNLQ